MHRPLALLALAACAPAVQAPETTEAKMVFGFEHFDEDGFLEVLVDPLAAWSDDHLDELTEGYAIDALTAEDVAAAGVTDVDTTNILGAMGHAEYGIDPTTVAMGITWDDKLAIHESLVSYEVLSRDGDLDCFLAQACDRYAYEAHEVAKVPLLGESDRTYLQQLRWLFLADGRAVLAVRQIDPEPMSFTVKLLAVHQQYGFSLIFPVGAGARRLEAFWIDAEILGEFSLPEGFAVRQAADAMQSSASEFEAWLATR